MAISRLLLLLAPALLAGQAVAHGGAHSQAPQVEADADWATIHLAEEHHISNFDPGAFFSLHDFDTSGYWDPSDIHTFYGFNHESTSAVPSIRKDECVREVLALYDTDRDGLISREEWFEGCKKGVQLPDFGYGPGHHGDDEYEYEIHHWEKYHDENTREEDLIHPEDIEHFAKHEQMEEEQERVDALNQMPIVRENIPKMFLV